MEFKKKYADYSAGNLGHLFINTFKIYLKQFPVLVLFLAPIELIFFGVFRLVIIEIGLKYDYILQRVILILNLNSISGANKITFFVLFIFLIILFILRSIFISTTTVLATETERTYVIVLLENTLKRIKEIILFMLLGIILLIFPFLLIILGVFIQPRYYILSWIMIFGAIFFPIMFMGKISLFVGGMTKDDLHIGAALQKSWTLTRGINYYRTIFIALFFASLCLVFPWILANYLRQQFDMIYIGFLMALFRAIIYPFMDIAFTLNYLYLDYQAVNQAVFKDAILEQRKRSEELLKQNIKEKNS